MFFRRAFRFLFSFLLLGTSLILMDFPVQANSPVPQVWDKKVIVFPPGGWSIERQPLRVKVADGACRPAMSYRLKTGFPTSDRSLKIDKLMLCHYGSVDSQDTTERDKFSSEYLERLRAGDRSRYLFALLGRTGKRPSSEVLYLFSYKPASGSGVGKDFERARNKGFPQLGISADKVRSFKSEKEFLEAMQKHPPELK